jgi:hypothetical protein
LCCGSSACAESAKAAMIDIKGTAIRERLRARMVLFSPLPREVRIMDQPSVEIYVVQRGRHARKRIAAVLPQTLGE